MAIEQWKSGEVIHEEKQISNYIRNYLFKKYDNKCCKCGWCCKNESTGLIPLEVHHIDGNYKNNKEDNLELLCPNCHSITPTFKSLNRGNGRDGR